MDHHDVVNSSDHYFFLFIYIYIYGGNAMVHASKYMYVEGLICNLTDEPSCNALYLLNSLWLELSCCSVGQIKWIYEQ